MKRRATAETLRGSIPPTSLPRRNGRCGPLPKRRYGRTTEELSIIGFGGMIVKDVTPKDAANFVAEAVDRGVNYFDVAPYLWQCPAATRPGLEALSREMLPGLQDPGTGRRWGGEGIAAVPQVAEDRPLRPLSASRSHRRGGGRASFRPWRCDGNDPESQAGRQDSIHRLFCPQ